MDCPAKRQPYWEGELPPEIRENSAYTIEYKVNETLVRQEEQLQSLVKEIDLSPMVNSGTAKTRTYKPTFSNAVEVEVVEPTKEKIEDASVEEVVQEVPQAVNLNTASVEEIIAVNGIGAKLANKIVDARPFVSMEDLEQKVKLGFGREWNSIDGITVA